MAQDKITKCLGLVTQYSQLSVAPGALARANDCLIRRENIIEDRRGHKAYATMANDVEQLLTYSNRVITHHGTVLAYDNGSGTFAAYSGSYSAPSGAKIRGVEAFSNLYVTTSAGVKVFSNVTGTAGRLAGAPRSLGPTYTLTGSSGFLADTYQCAYRSVLRRTDAQTNVITGYPSQRIWVINAAGGSRNVILTNYLPSDAASGDVIQFYRTEQFSGTSTDSSGDEMGLVYQYELTSSDISTGYVTFTDSVVDALRGATLYTSSSQEGISQANDRPPLAKDIALYKNHMFYANTQTKQRLYITLVGTSALSSRSITLGGVTYNFGASEIISGAGSPQALVSATGVAAVDIDLTARSLEKVINRFAGNTTVYAYYLTGPGDLPGQLVIEERGVGGAAFSVFASDTTIAPMFFPAPPVSPATSTKSTSSNDVRKNAIAFSKASQGEHVPLLNYLLVGAANKEILRIVALQRSLIVIKEEGIFRILGENASSFVVEEVDLTVFCKAQSSVVVLSNQVFMLSNQGVVAISENGVQVVSREIEPSLNPLLINSSLASYTTACAYESERSYFLSTITETGDTAANQTFVYNIFTRTWVRHSYPFSAAVVEPSADKMYFAKPAGEVIFVERKSFTDADYADPEISITITALGTNTVDFTISGDAPEVGWVIEQGGSEIPITDLTVISGGYRATLESAVPGTWTASSATLYPAVGMDIEWLPWTGANPDLLKQVYGVALLSDDSLDDNSATAMTATFRSNFDYERIEVDMTQSRFGWGAGAWGSIPWGGGSDSVGYPTYVPRNMQYSTRLTVGFRHKYARQKLVIAGLALYFNAASDRIGR